MKHANIVKSIFAAVAMAEYPPSEASATNTHARAGLVGRVPNATLGFYLLQG